MYRTPKDFLLGDENILKNFTVEILRLCVRESVIVKQEVVSLAVSLYSLDPQNGITLDGPNDQEDAEAFKTKVANKLLALDSVIKTLEIQIVFMEKIQNVENIKTIYDKRLSEKTEAIQKEILEFEAVNIEQQDQLFRLIVVDIIVCNKLGKPNNEQVYSETANALRSIFSRTDLVEFIQVTKKKKRLETLDQLRKLVCGIRLFNKDVGRCGEGIRDIVQDVTLGFKNTRLALTDVMIECHRRISSISKVLKGVFSCENIFEILDIIELDEYEQLRDSLMLYSQHAVYVSALLETLNQSKHSMDVLSEVFKDELYNVHENVKFRIAVGTEKVYPHFIRLQKIWASFMTYLYAFVEINHLNDDMKSIANSGRIEQDVLHSLSVALRGKHKKINFSVSVHITNPDCKILKCGDFFAMPTTKYCAYLFVVGGGILIPSQPSLGVLQYKTHYFGFCEAVYLNWFSEDIESYVQKYFEIIRANPPLIVLFDCFDKIVQLNCQKKADPEPTVAEVQTVEVQTELHPIPYYKDKDYTWNIWDLRRKAIQLANIRNCRTHSTQTDVSYHRMGVRLQTAEQKEQSDQTMRTTSTNCREVEEEVKEVVENSASLARIKKCLWK